MLCLLFFLSAQCAQAARPLPDLHKWDSYFALFARNSSVPWKESTVRLDTYSSAPVDFRLYAADPGDILVAGTNAPPRVLDTAHLQPLAAWRFTPPGGYRYEANNVAVPLGAREGFFIVEARRNNVVQQVWIDRTRIGLLSKQCAGTLLLYGADLGSGRALAHMRVSFLAGAHFIVRYTESHGLIRWTAPQHPIFALADYGASKAFVSFLPQAPLANSLGGVFVDSAVVRAGEHLRIVGFARTRAGTAFKPASGQAQITIRSGSAVIVQQRALLDAAGAFATEVTIPPASRAGDYTVLMNAGNANAGNTLHVDANAEGLALKIVPAATDGRLTMTVAATRDASPVAGASLRVRVVRSPHIYSSSAPSASEWGLTKILDQEVVTGPDGLARISLDRPSDGLASTYGIRVSLGAATASTRLVVPTSDVALRIDLASIEQSLGNPIGFDVYATAAADGKPWPNLPVRVQLVHGVSVQEQNITLDGEGHGHGSFSTPELGSSLIMARATANGKQALDAQEVRVDPGARPGVGANPSSDVMVALDRDAYRVGERARVEAFVAGAGGDALMTYETAAGIDANVVAVHDGHARSSFTAHNAAGAVQAGAALVRDGELRWGAVPVALTGAGRAQASAVHIDGRTFAPGATAHLKIDEGKTPDRTIIVRMSSGIPTGPARFDGAPGLLSIGQVATQDSAPPSADWHAGIDAAATHALTLSFDRTQSPRPEDLSIAQAQSTDLYWRVERSNADVQIPLPRTPGTYTLSILELGDDGHVAANSTSIKIQ